MHETSGDTPDSFPSSWRSVLIFCAAILVIAVMAARATSGTGATNPATIYLSVMAFQWGAVYYVWHVVRGRGRSLADLIGGRSQPRAILTDLLLAAAFWLGSRAMLIAIAAALGEPAHANIQRLLPKTLTESMLWIALSMTAGFCEELLFRGFLQRQLHVLTRSTVLAVTGQAILFGVSHAYQGWQPTIAITAYGLLIGAMAQWRRSLRPGMIAHAWQDIAAGLIRWKWL